MAVTDGDAAVALQPGQDARARKLDRVADQGRLPLLMGSTPLRPGDQAGATPGEAWVAWYVRASLREIAPPTGVIDQEALRRAIDLAIEHEIDPQIAYHRSNAHRLHRLEHRLESTAVWLLRLTILSGLIFLAGYGSFLISGEKDLLKEIVKPWSTFAGGVLPVFGAALFGIRATGDFRSAVRQSQRMVHDLEILRAQLQALRADPDRPHLRRLFARTLRTMSDDLRLWGMIYSERALEAGF